MARNYQKEILGSKKKLELLWFKENKDEKEKLEDLTIAYKNKTKIFISLNHEYSKEFLESLIKGGFMNFQIDGSRLNLKIYNKIVSNLIDYAQQKSNTRPVIIFDLKSPMPLITKISCNRKILKINQGQKIRISYESKKDHDGDVIYIDKKIHQGINVGDILLISYPELRLKVVGVENSFVSSASYTNLRQKENSCQTNSINKIKSLPFLHKQSPYEKHFESYKETYKIVEKDMDYYDKNLFNEEINLNLKEDGIKNKYSPLNPGNIIEEDEEYLIDPNNFDNFDEEMLKHKHDKLEESYHKIIRKHSLVDNELFFNENNKILKEMDKISAISQTDQSGNISCQSNPLSQENKQISYKVPQRKLFEKSKNKNKLIICEALEEGVITEYKSITMIGKNIIQQCDLPILSAKDINDLNQTHIIGINIISALIEQPSDIDDIKEILGEETSKRIKIFAKIETKNGIVNFDSILEKADAIIIQNFLASTNFNYSEIRSVVMYIIQRCKIKNKPIILKINSLKSININRPVLSKMSSLDFSVKEGIDSILIYEENFNFNESEYLSNINAFRQTLLEIEGCEDNIKNFDENSKFFSINKRFLKDGENTYSCLMECAAKLSHEIKADLIILYTDYFLIGKVLSQFRPYCITALPLSDEKEVNYLRLFRGIIPYFCQEDKLEFHNREISIQILINDFKLKRLVKDTLDKVIVVNAYSNKNYKYKNSIFVVNSNSFIKK